MNPIKTLVYDIMLELPSLFILRHCIIMSCVIYIKKNAIQLKNLSAANMLRDRFGLEFVIHRVPVSAPRYPAM